MRSVLLYIIALLPLLLSPVPLAFGQQVQRFQNERLDAALRQAYDLSRANFAAPSMLGGAGIRFMPPMEMMMQMMQVAGLSPENAPVDPFLVMAVYSSGNPTLPEGSVASFMNSTGGRWDPDQFDTTITPRAQAALSLKLTEWAKFFHLPYAGGSPIFFTEEMEKFLALVFTAQSKMIIQFSTENLLTESGFVQGISLESGEREIIDSTIDPLDQALMLWAISDLAGTLDSDVYFQLKDPDSADNLSGLADQTFRLVEANEATTPIDRSLTIVSLVWYATQTSNGELREDAISLIRDYADSLTSPIERTAEGAPEIAASIRGLLEAYRVTGDDRYVETAVNLWNQLESLWDDDAGFYAKSEGAQTYTYSSFEVGLIFGALGELREVIGDATADYRIQREAEERIVDIVLEGFLTRSIRIPGNTFPPILFAEETSYDGSSWSVTSPIYDSVGALYLANELIWLEGLQVNGYPSVSKLATERADFILSSGGGPVDAQVEALGRELSDINSRLDSAVGERNVLQSEIDEVNSRQTAIVEERDLLQEQLSSVQNQSPTSIIIFAIVGIAIGLAVGILVGRRRGG